MIFYPRSFAIIQEQSHYTPAINGDFHILLIFDVLVTLLQMTITINYLQS